MKLKLKLRLNSVGVAGWMMVVGAAGAAVGMGSETAQADILINGAGATFPYPIYSKWFSEYYKANPGVRINYQSIGSGGGIRQLMDQTVDFGASDAPMTDAQLARAKLPILHIPTVLGAVVLTYNLPGVQGELRLDPAALSDLYFGKIRRWNDPKLVALNPTLNLPNIPVVITHRSDGSGTTAIFTDYLAKVSPDWKQKVGAGTAVKWPTGLGGKGNEGVTGLVKQTPGGIGYVELIYALTNKMPVASMKNSSGNFIVPDMKSVTAAAAGSLKTMPEDFRVSITNSAGAMTYPISGFTYILVYQKMGAEKGKPLVDFLKWSIGPGQKLASDLLYAPLPTGLLKKVEQKIARIETQ